MRPIDSNDSPPPPYSVIDAFSTNRSKITNIERSTDIDSQIKNPVTNLNKTDKPKQKRPNKTEDYLKIGVIRTMLKKFLDEKKMAKENLANALRITDDELDRLLFYKTVIKIKQKINLPLIKLFCETKWP